MKKAIYPGSFDPVTYGHEDIIGRAAGIFDELTVAVLNNVNKVPMFSVEERVDMLKHVCAEYSNITIKSFEGLLVDFAHAEDADVIVRGLRAVTDFEYELQLSQLNKVLSKDVDTIFLTTNLKYSYLSSSSVKEIASFGGNIKEFVDPYVEEMILKKLHSYN